LLQRVSDQINLSPNPNYKPISLRIVVDSDDEVYDVEVQRSVLLCRALD
jgi:hypothetical protein